MSALREKHVQVFLAFGFALFVLTLVVIFSNEQFFRVLAGSVAGVVVLPALILSWIDAGRVFRRLGQDSKRYYVLGQIFGYPQSAFGCVSFMVGLGSLLLGGHRLIHEVPLGIPVIYWLLVSIGFMSFGLSLAWDAFGVLEEGEVERGE